MSQIDKSKEYTTRDGRPARIYATDAGGIYPVHGTVWDAGEGCWSIHQWVEGGRFWSSSEEDHPLDLVENPRTVAHKLLEALEAATPGPWSNDARATASEVLANAHLIANASTWLAALCDRVEELEAALRSAFPHFSNGEPVTASAIAAELAHRDMQIEKLNQQHTADKARDSAQGDTDCTSEPNKERNRLKRELLEELMELALGSEGDSYRGYDGHVAEWLRDQLKGMDD